jgi:hypothetical protein
LAGIVPHLGAQEEEEEPEEDIEIPIESEWSAYVPAFYAAGDQTFSINLGVIFPTVFTDNSGIIDHKLNVLGGTGSLAYNYFLTPQLFIGGEIGGMFCGTIGKNMLFIVPMGIKIGYQFVLWRFEFPVSVLIGAAPQSYLKDGLIGFIAKPMASVFYRFSPDWSFGLNAEWWWVPQKTRIPSQDVTGNFFGLTLSAAYHF